MPETQPVSAFHGGRFFERIGEDFDSLERNREVISADVLDAWFDPSPRVTSKLTTFLPFLLRTSPPVQASGLVRTIARVRRVPEDCVLTAGGSSDLIFACLVHLVGASAKVAILDPMYGEYRHLFETVRGASILRFPLHKEEHFRVETDRFLRFVQAQRPDLVAIVNPNSPTGQHWSRKELLRFLALLPITTLAVVDETYIEYAGTGESIENEASGRENLIVVKSMSKVYALSGIRVGYIVASPKMVRTLGQWVPPWAVSLPAQVAAVEALKDPEYYEQRYEETHSLRRALANGIEQIRGVTVYPAIANFLLVEVSLSAELVRDFMSKYDVFVRNCDSMSDHFHDRFLRIAVKNATQNRTIQEMLGRAVREGR